MMSAAHTEDVGTKTPTEDEPVREVERHHEPHDEAGRSADAGRVVDPVQMERILALAVQRRPAETAVAGEFFGREPLEIDRDGT